MGPERGRGTHIALPRSEDEDGDLQNAWTVYSTCDLNLDCEEVEGGGSVQRVEAFGCAPFQIQR